MPPNRLAAERQSIQILLVEDDPDDVWVMRNLLGDRWDGPFELTHVELLSAGHGARQPTSLSTSYCLTFRCPTARGWKPFSPCTPTPATCRSWCCRATTTNRSRFKAVQAGRRTTWSRARWTTTCSSARSATPSSGRGGTQAEEALRDASEEFRAAKEIQQRLFPFVRAAAARFRHCRRALSGQGHRRRLLRLHPHAGRLPGRGGGRRQQPRHGAGAVDVGDAGLPAHAARSA